MTVPPPTIRTEVPAEDPRQLHVIIDNPTARNGLSADTAAQLGRVFISASEDPAVRCVVLRGAGDHFCAGADLRTAGGLLKGGEEGLRRVLAEGYHVALQAIFDCTKPTLAVIRGA